MFIASGANTPARKIDNNVIHIPRETLIAADGIQSPQGNARRIHQN